MIKCPNCGHENVPGTQFCEGCGEELKQATASTAASAPTAAADQMVKCPACDNMNPADSAFCEACGAELRIATGDAADAVPPIGAPSASGLSANAPSPDATGTTTPAVTDANAVLQGDLGRAPDVIAPPDAAAAVPAPGAVAGDSTPPGTVVATAPATSGATPTPPLTGTQTNLITAPLEPGSVKLVVEQGQTIGAQFVLGDPEMLVGREDEEEDIYPDIDLSDQDAGYVHRRHATLRFENGQLTVTHLGGVNKTRVNNKPIPDNEPQPLSLGDKVAFGKVVMRLRPA